MPLLTSRDASSVGVGPEGLPGAVDSLTVSEARALTTLIATALVLSGVYYFGAQIGFLLTFPSVPTSIFWIPNATMFAAFLLAPPRRWWVYILAVAPAHVLVQVQNGVPPLPMALLFLTNMGDGALGAIVVRRFSHGAPRFDGFRNVLAFLVMAVVAPFVVSFLDAAIVALTWNGNYWLVWHTRFRSNALTNVVWVPAVVIAVSRASVWTRLRPRRRYLEAALLVSALLLVVSLVFGTPQVRPGVRVALLYAPLPLFMWAAARFGTGGVSASQLVFAFLVIWYSVRGEGPFTLPSPEVNILALQVFLTLLAAPLLLLAALLQERRRTEDALRDREAQYRSIFESTTDGVLITNLAHGVVAANPAFCHLTGYHPAQLGEMHPRDIFQPDNLELFDAYLARASAGAAVETKAICVREDRRLSRVVIQGRRFSYAGEPHVLSVVHDVGESEKAYEQLEERVAERTRALSTLLEISNTVASNLELGPLLRVVLEQLQVIVEHTGATIFTRDDEDLVILDHRGPLTAAQVCQVRIPARWAAEHPALMRDSPLIVDDLWGDSATAKAFRATLPVDVAALFAYARSLLVVPLKTRDRQLGFLQIDSRAPHRYSLHDAELAWALANQAAVAIENARLYDQGRELAALEERQRLARELHDSVTQTLYAASMLGELLPRTWESDPVQGRRSLASLREMTRTALAEMRTLLLELRPAALLQSSLGDLLRQLAEGLRSRSEAPIDVEVEGSTELPPDVQVTLYRVAQELLSNIIKHAAASSVHLALRCSRAGAELCIRDDGRGFDPAQVSPSHFGIAIMRERLAAIGAALSIESEAERGTLVTVMWSQRERSA